MFKVVKPIAKWPALYPEVERVAPTVGENANPGYDKVGDFVLRDKIDFMPQKGLQEDFCHCESNLIFLCGPSQVGKAQPYDAKVLTPNGFVDMGSLKVGSVVVGANGQEQRVLAIYEQGEKDVFRVTFDDGAQTECCAEHLWKVAHTSKSARAYREYKVLQFEEIAKLMDSGLSVAIPFAEPIAFKNDSFPIHPYVLGCLLGNGCFPKSNILISTPDTEMIERIVSHGYKCTKLKPDRVDYRISGNDIRRSLRELGLRETHSWNKFIPEEYKFASIESRFALLQGLIDTDGHVDKKGHLVYYTVSPQLAKDVQWLIRSLGGRCRMTLKVHPKFVHKGVKKEGRDCYVLGFNFGNNNHRAVSLTRKRQRIKDHYGYVGKVFRHRMVKYECVGRKKCRCIKVSNSDSLYITDDFIVTHNTFAMLQKVEGGLGRPGFTTRFINVRLQDGKKGGSIFRDAVEILGNYAGCQYSSADYPTFFWPQWNNSFQIIHSNFNADVPAEYEQFKDYAKKNQASLIMIDEATEMRSFKMFKYWFSRNRDSSGMTPQMVLSFNYVYGHFTNNMLKDAGYFTDGWYFRPEMNGVTRYFYITGDTESSIVWGDTAEEVAEAVGIELSESEKAAGVTYKQIIKSFTAYTGDSADNRKLLYATGGQNIGNLHNVGGIESAILLKGYAGPVENETANVNRQMVHSLWENPIDNDENMYATMDVSGGSLQSDNSPMVIWRGLQIVDVKFFRGDSKELVAWIDKQLKTYGVPIDHFAYDATGIGYYLRSYTSGWPITANKRCLAEYDENGNQVLIDEYFNLRSQLFGKTEVLMKRGEISIALNKDAVIPYGKNGTTRKLIDVLFDEINVFVTQERNKKIYYRSKDEYKAKFHSSPDLIDAIAYRAIFELDTRERKQPKPQVREGAYRKLFKQPPRMARRGFHGIYR